MVIVRKLLPFLEEKNIPAVILPTDYSKNWVPETVDDRVRFNRRNEAEMQ